MSDTHGFQSVGVPREIKSDERRVALTPDGASELHALGKTVLVEYDAGLGAGFANGDYEAAGAIIVDSAADAWGAELVVKVKEPQDNEFSYLRSDLTLFTYLHLAAYPGVATALCDAGTTGFAYETVTDDNGGLPLLAPMSEIAGQLAAQMGAHHLSAHLGGAGLLLGGVPGVLPAEVLVLGGGNVGWAAARVALGLGANVTIVDRSIERLIWIDEHKFSRLRTLASSRAAVARAVASSDLVIGAVLVAGGRAPVVVSEDMVRTMRKGSVIVDVAVDQGGCVETTIETSHREPTREVHGIVHYAVGNMPGAVPRTSTLALTNVTLPRIAELAQKGTDHAIASNSHLGNGLNTRNGEVVNAVVAQSISR